MISTNVGAVVRCEGVIQQIVGRFCFVLVVNVFNTLAKAR
jgi:hypothetical protein